MATRVEELLAEARWLEGLALALVGEREAARDLVQDVWVRTLEDPPRDVRRPRAWLGRVLRNALSSRRRSESARASRELAHERDGARGADDVVERAEAQRHLVEAVLALDEPLRKTVLLRFFDGLSSTEIARRQGVPDSTVRTRLAQALEQLRQRLERSRTDWRTGLGLIACGRRELERGSPWPPNVKAGACVAAAVIGGLWLWSELLSPERAPAPLVSSAVEPQVNLVAASEPSASGERQVAEVAEASPPSTAPLAQELFRLRIVALVLAEGSEQPIPHAEVLFADHVVATGDERGRIDQEFVVREDAPRELLRQFAESRKDYVPSSSLFVRAPGWTSRRVEIRDRLVNSILLGVVSLRPAGEVRGVVLDEDGAPQPLVDITWRAGLPAETPWAPGPEWEAMIPEAKTDSEGRFLLRGVPAETGFVIAGSPAHTYANSPVFRLPPGEEREFTFVLPPSEELSALVEGVVLDPTGTPLPDAHVELFAGRAGEWFADEEGRFARPWIDEGPITVVASDARGRYRPAVLVRPDVSDAQGLILRLSEGRVLVEARSADGGKLEHARIRCSWKWPNGLGGDHGLEVPERWTDANGRAELERPPTAFTLRVEAAGHRLAERVVPEGEPLSEPLLVILEPRRSILGRVVHAGRPIAGALVHGGRTRERPYRSAQVFEGENAFDCAFPVGRDPLAPRTDAEGRFQLTEAALPDTPLLLFWVEAEGFPTTTFGPFPAFGAEELVLDMAPSGRLEGRVLLPLGARAFGRVVGVCNGLGFARTVPVEEDGSYRLDDLAPGDYQVRCVPGPAAEWVQFETYGPERSGPIRFDCRVASGTTAHFDVDLRGEGQCVCLVQVVFPSQEERWNTGSLFRIEADGGATFVTRGTLDAEGRVEFRVATPGRHRFVAGLGEGFGSGPTTSLIHEFELVSGESAMTLDLAAGSLRLGPEARYELAGGPAKLLRIDTTTERWSASTTITLLSLQQHAIPVPSGKLRLEATHVPFWSQDTVWTPVGELTLAPGETVDPFAAR